MLFPIVLKEIQLLNKGDVINRIYQIIGEIGEGGMGTIYLAYHLNLQKYVVIKKIKDDYVGRIEARGEVDIMKNLNHTNLPHIYDFVQIGTQIFTVMSYIEGLDFSYYIKLRYHFEEDDIIKWLTQCLDVLEYLHSRNPAIIHRDIKPGNIMLDAEGNICVIDFNISFDESSGTNVMAASKAYASPEQLNPVRFILPDGQTCFQLRIDKRSDIYSLGATFYHIMTGIKPYEGINSEYPIVSLDIGYSDALKRIIFKAMSNAPEDRFQSAKEMLDAVRNIYKSTLVYRAKRVVIVAGTIAGSILIGSCIVMGYRSAKRNKIYKFNRNYNQVVQICAETTPEKCLDEAISLLNNDDYASVLEDYPQKKGMLLYQVALSYYELASYDEANNYFDEALDYISDAGCIKNYVISLAKSGDLLEAQRILNRYSDILSELDETQISAEIAYIDGDYSKAEEDLEYLLQEYVAVSDKSRNIILLSEVYSAQGKYEEIVDLINSSQLSSEYSIVKEKILANAYIGMASEQGVENSATYYKDARTSLENLKNEDMLDLNSAVSLIVVYLNTGELQKAENYLNVLLDEYPDDYRVLVQQCFLDYNKQINRGTGQYYYVTFKEHYNKAMEAYSEQNPGVMDKNVEKLRQIYQLLKDKGYV